MPLGISFNVRQLACLFSIVTSCVLFCVSCSDEVSHYAPVTDANITESTPVAGAGGATRWQLPANGKIQAFSWIHKGINIIGYVWQPIFAAAAGKVVYSGDGIRGYGNLIIIKHNNLYLSAYAYNQTNLVKEGVWVKRGQIIAKMGMGESETPMLHFEIRRAGKPIDPAFYLNQA